MRYRTLIFMLGALSSSQVSAGEFQSVYVAPGGVYIASGPVYIRPGNVDSPYVAPRSTYYEPRYVPPAYEPGYVPPGPVYRSPAYYGATRSMYPARSAYVNRQSEYSSAYVTELPLRPPASVPYVGGERCVTDPAYGPSVYCD
jgi:hypothetical protein